MELWDVISTFTVILITVIGVWIILNTWDEYKEDVSKFRGFMDYVDPEEFNYFEGVEEDDEDVLR